MSPTGEGTEDWNVDKIFRKICFCFGIIKSINCIILRAISIAPGRTLADA